MRTRLDILFLLTLTLLTAANVQASSASKGSPPPKFSKAFVPDTIGPGSTAMLVFTIDNSSGGPVTGLAFADTLPGGMTLAAPAFVSNTCTGESTTVSATDGGTTVTLSEGEVGAGGICQIVVNVTAVAQVDTTYRNVSGDLTSSAGNSGAASANLMVDVDRPGFSKSFSPSTVPIGGRSTLTFTIDNQLNQNAAALLLFFTDSLPDGMVVAGPSNATTDCDFSSAPTLTAAPGTGVIGLSSGGVAAGATCTVSVDVVGGAVGSLGNVSGELTAFVAGAGSVSSGKAAAVLEVTGVDDLLELRKEFTDDPVPPGGTTTLQFTVTNKSRDDSATGINFSDDLDATLMGLTATFPPGFPCGGGSSLAFGGGVLVLSNGRLLPGRSCTFSVDLTVPAGAAPGAYPNTAGPVMGDIGGSPETGNVAGDLLFVVSFPLLVKEFTDDPVAAGDFVTLEFTIINTNPNSTLSDIQFIDELTGGTAGTGPANGFLPFPVTVTLPPDPDPPCGIGSSLALVTLDTDRQALALTGGSLAAAGSAGDSCMFSVSVEIPLSLESGTYTNTTEEISAVLDDVTGTPTVLGPPGSDDVVVLAAPDLAKEFIDDPVIPGGTVTLRFTLDLSESAAGPATNIAFSDDLTALVPPVPGLTATAVGSNTCAGSTVDISTPTLIGFFGGTMMPGDECAFTVTLSVPAASPPGFHTNATSNVTATVAGLTVPSDPAQDGLLITPLVFTKAFTGGPVIAGDTVDLEFTIENLSPTDDATSIFFTDNLSAAVPGLAVSGALPAAPCGAGSTISGTSLLTFSGGEALAGGPPCAFTVTVLVPAMTPDDAYVNATSDLAATIGGSPIALPPADAELIVDSTLLALTKEFTDDPVEPGGTVSLEFNLTNLSATETVTDIAFDDDLDAALSGLEASGAMANTCGGMAAGFPAGLFQYSGGMLLPGASCMIVLNLDVPMGPLAGDVFTNTTTGVTGKVGALDVFGDPASDDLDVDLLVFTKAFNGPTTRGGTAVLTFTIENLDTLNAVSALAFSDNLDTVISGLTATGLPGGAPCGPGSSVTGTSVLALTGASLPAGGLCSFDVTVTVPRSSSFGSFLNTTSALSSNGLPVAPGATALLTVLPRLIFADGFEN